MKMHAGKVIVMLFTAFSLQVPAWAETQGSTAPTQTASLGSYPKQSGPHGAYDPHASLSSEKMTQVALQHWQEGRAADAFLELAKTIGQYPSDGTAYAVRASLYLQQEKVAEALSDLQQSLQLSPDNAEALTNRAQVYRRFNRLGEAMDDLNRAIALEPTLLAARFNRGTVYVSQQDYQAALADFDFCINTDPHMANAYFNRAITHDSLGERTEAITDLEQFLQLSNNPKWNKMATEQLEAWGSAVTVSNEGTGT